MPCLNLLPEPNAAMRAYRAALLRFDPAADPRQAAVYEADGLLVLGLDASGAEVVQDVGDWAALAPRYPGLAVEHLPGRLIAPGFIDMHVHFPQLNVIGSPADGLLPWLENHTFPEEQRFESPDYCAAEAEFFSTNCCATASPQRWPLPPRTQPRCRPCSPRRSSAKCG